MKDRTCKECGDPLGPNAHGGKKYCAGCAAMKIGKAQKVQRAEFITVALPVALRSRLRGYMASKEKDLVPGSRWTASSLVAAIVEAWLKEKGFGA